MPLSTSRPAYIIPRVHFPSAGTAGQETSFADVFSLPAFDEWHNEATDSNSTTIYNPSYRTNDVVEEANFGIFDDLERYGPMDRRRVMQMEMNSSFEGNEDNQSDLVADMLEDMTKNDHSTDDFVEALNFNLVIPRTNL